MLLKTVLKVQLDESIEATTTAPQVTLGLGAKP